ncbi:MAG: methyltransferase domain-containing protein [Deltaproteobacteria bacterium]|nr:methyltransferase domain-containing protein [Deltaproteobacteria bacterium]
MLRHRGHRLRFEAKRANLSGLLRERFVEVPPDDATRQWIDDAIDRPNKALALAARAVARTMLSDYDANALAGTHDMRVVGTGQLERLLAATKLSKGGRLLDVGAGDGHVTAELAPLFDAVETTELSKGMAKRLREKGYLCHEKDLVHDRLIDVAPFDAIALLNVIDRTSHPISLLENLRDLMAPGAWLLIATPLPLAPHVHVGPATVDPEEMLPIDRRSWEHAASTLESDLLRPLGYDVRSLSRVPYLCRGGKRQPVVQLDDALFLCTRA